MFKVKDGIRFKNIQNITPGSNGFWLGDSVWVNHTTGNYNNYNENIRLVAAGNGASVITFNASGEGGEGGAGAVLGYSDRMEIRKGGTWEQRLYSGYAEARGSYRAPIFYDTNDTGYYVDPNGNTRLYNISDHLTFFRNQTSSIAIENQSSFCRIAYNELRFYEWDVGGDMFTLNGNYGQFTNSVRAPIFYDSNNTDYWLDPNNGDNPANTSLRIRGGIQWSTDELDFTVGVHSGMQPMSLRLWDNYTQPSAPQSYGTVLDIYGRSGHWRHQFHYLGDTLQFRSGGYGSEAWSSWKTMWHSGLTSFSSSGDRPLHYSSGGGTMEIQGNSGGWGMVYGFRGSSGSHRGGYGVLGSGDGLSNYWIGQAYNDYMVYITGSELTHVSSVRAPIFYDTNNTGYYVDPNSSAVLRQLRIDYPDTSLYIGNGDTSRAYSDGSYRSGISITNLYPHIDINGSGGTNATHGAVLSFTGTLSAGGYRRFGIGVANYNPDIISIGYADNQQNPHYGVGGSGWSQWWLDTSGNNFVTGSMRAPIFYDQDDTGYYVNPNGTSVFSTVTTYGQIYINNGSPTIYLQDTDHRSSMIHCNSNVFYVLRGSGTNSSGWATYNGYWPMEISLENNNATFGGNITAVYNITAYSDARLKENVEPLKVDIDAFKSIKAKRFDWIRSGKHDIGFIAQDVEAAGFTEVVIETERKDPDTGEYIETNKSLDYGRMVAILWDVVQEQQIQIEDLSSQLKSLKEK